MTERIAATSSNGVIEAIEDETDANECSTNGGDETDTNECSINGGDETDANEYSTNGGGDETDANECSTNGEDDEAMVDGLDSLEIEEQLEVVSPVGKDDDYYNMNHKNRGMAVILNHEEFDPSCEKQIRKGTKKDGECLDKTLKKLGFDVHEYHNCTFGEIDDILHKVSKEDHKDSDCFVLVCMTHGASENLLYAYDSKYRVKRLWSPFTPDKCPTLAGKPKLFFIQACRGPLTDVGFNLRIQTDSGASFKIPHSADFLIGYSTIPGYLSFRNSAGGAVFIQMLCEVLSEHGFKEHLLDLLTLVNRRVAIEYESYAPSNPEKHKKKQMPTISTMLIRKVHFKEK